MSHQPVIDGLEFAKSSSRLQGSWPVAGFGRLRDLLQSSEGTLHYELRGVPEAQGYPALRLKVDGALQLGCQRCLAAYAFPLQIEILLRLAATQAEMDAEPLEAEGPDSIVTGRQMPVKALVEDEVLLAIPIAPRHADCSGSEKSAEGAKQGPFAELRGLFGGTKH